MIEYFPKYIINELKIHAESKAPEEMCGFIISKDNKYIFKPVENKAEDKVYNFEIDPKDYIEAELTGNIECIMHSHNNSPHASEADQKAQMSSNIPFGLVFLNNNNYHSTVFWGDQLPVQDLLGRPFIYGIYDCYGLVRDYYRKKLNLTVNNYYREMNWWRDTEDRKAIDLLNMNIEDNDLIEIPFNELKKHDMVLFQIRGIYANHSAIYLGDGLILHHIYGKASRREPYNRLTKYITKVLRRKELC